MVKAELLSIGDELLIGQVVNTNVSFIGKMLGTLGFKYVAKRKSPASHNA